MNDIKKKQPQRMCIVCRKMMDKTLLNRVVKKQDGTVCLDANGKTEGRGAYVCFDKQCVAKCQKNNLLNKHLKTVVSKEIYENLKVSDY